MCLCSVWARLYIHLCSVPVYMIMSLCLCFCTPLCEHVNISFLCTHLWVILVHSCWCLYLPCLFSVVVFMYIILSYMLHVLRDMTFSSYSSLPHCTSYGTFVRHAPPTPTKQTSVMYRVSLTLSACIIRYHATHDSRVTPRNQTPYNSHKHFTMTCKIKVMNWQYV